MIMKYTPKPLDTSDVELSEDIILLSEVIAKNVHENWAKARLEEGWTYGPVRNSEKKITECLVSYEELPEIEKDYDRNTALETLKLLIKLGYKIEKVEDK